MQNTALPVLAQQALALAVLLPRRLPFVHYVRPATVARVLQVQADVWLVPKAHMALLLLETEAHALHAE